MDDPRKHVVLLRDGLESLLGSCGADPDGVHIVSMVVSTPRRSAGDDGRVLIVSNLSVVPTDAEPTREQLMGLWNRVVEYRDKHELSCIESVYQMDAPQVGAIDLAGDLVTIVGFVDSDEDDE